MRIRRIPSATQTSSAPSPAAQDSGATSGERAKRRAARRPSWLALGVGALGFSAGLRPAAACKGLNPMHNGWMSPPNAWPSPITYGDILTLLASENSGPNCLDSDYYDFYGAKAFYEQTFGCGSTAIGVGFCASSDDFGFLKHVDACKPLTTYESDWSGSQSLLPINVCGVLRAKDCIFFLPDDDNFQAIQDSFTRAYDPKCRGFNPRQAHWTHPKIGWPTPANVSTITDIANGCDSGPACGSTFNYDFRSFNCSGNVGTVIGDADLDLAFQAAQAACPANWEMLSTPPAGDLIPYNQTRAQSAWDVGFFFTPEGSGQMDASLLKAASREITALRHRHDAAFMWRTGMVSSATATAMTLVSYGLAQGSVIRKLGMGLGLGYPAGVIGVATGSVICFWPRIDFTARILSSVGLGAVGAAYLGVFFTRF